MLIFRSVSLATDFRMRNYIRGYLEMLSSRTGRVIQRNSVSKTKTKTKNKTKVKNEMLLGIKSKP